MEFEVRSISSAYAITDMFSLGLGEIAPNCESCTVGQSFLVQKVLSAGYFGASVFGENWTEAKNLKTPKFPHYFFYSQAMRPFQVNTLDAYLTNHGLEMSINTKMFRNGEKS